MIEGAIGAGVAVLLAAPSAVKDAASGHWPRAIGKILAALIVGALAGAALITIITDDTV